jgi:hypothetical protein
MQPNFWSASGGIHRFVIPYKTADISLHAYKLAGSRIFPPVSGLQARQRRILGKHFDNAKKRIQIHSSKTAFPAAGIHRFFPGGFFLGMPAFTVC